MALIGAVGCLVHLFAYLLGIVEQTIYHVHHLALGKTLHVVHLCTTRLSAYIVGGQTTSQTAQLGVNHALGSVEGCQTGILHVDILAHAHATKIILTVLSEDGAREFHFAVAQLFLGHHILVAAAGSEEHHGH